jgi:hypothetical protein
MKGLFLTEGNKGEVKVYGYHDALNPKLVNMVKQTDMVVPAWLKKNTGLTTGYSGKLISFHKEDEKTILKVRQMVKDKELVKAIKTFDKMLEQTSLLNICELKAEENKESEQERTEWLLIQSLAAEDKEIALCTLGFDSSL